MGNLKNKNTMHAYDAFLKKFEAYSDQELVDAFNSQVQLNVWGNVRSAFLIALQSTFKQRGIMYTEIGSRHWISFADHVHLSNNRLRMVKSLPKDSLNELLTQWIGIYHPEKVVQSPKVSQVVLREPASILYHFENSSNTMEITIKELIQSLISHRRTNAKKKH